MRMRDALGPIYTDSAFAPLFPPRVSRPSRLPVWRWSPSCSLRKVSPIGRRRMQSAVGLTGSTRSGWSWPMAALMPRFSASSARGC